MLVNHVFNSWCLFIGPHHTDELKHEVGTD